MNFRLDDTIGALASASGPAARGIVRISGPQAVAWAEKCFEPAEPGRRKLCRAAWARAGSLRPATLCVPVPVLIYLWPGERSYTGQPLVEIHAPGSPPVLEAILAHAFELGVRPAAAGEFTARAFLTGRLDLVQAEAVLGVIDAESDQRLAAALRQLAGGISGRITSLRDGLVDLLADIEAGLDFVDEDIEFVSREALLRRVAQAQSALDDLCAQCQSRTHSTGRRRIVLAGLPNAGKSTLFNVLLGRDAALVSPFAGTTRDYLRGEAEWHGLALELIDTPGCDEERGGLMQQAHQLRRNQCEGADLIAWCSPCSQAAPPREEIDIINSVRRADRPFVLIRTKADLAASETHAVTSDRSVLGESVHPKRRVVAVSAKSGQGLQELVAACVEALCEQSTQSDELIGTTAARCRESLHHCREALSRVRRAAESESGDELIAVELREALDHLGRIVGTVYTDDILDRVFSRFCIGK